MTSNANNKLSLNTPNFKHSKTGGSANLDVNNNHYESDEDREFLELTDLIDMDRTYLDSAVEKFEETLFDAFTYCQILGTHSL